MEYSYDFEEGGICRVLVRGKLTRPADSHAIARLSCDIYKQSGCTRFLIDMRKASVQENTLETYAAGNVPIELAGTLVRLRAATLYSEVTKDLTFYENVANNRGQRMKLFDNYEDAVTWLKET